MQKQKSKRSAIAGVLLPLGLICLFAFCSLALALLGGQAYKQIQFKVDDSYGSTVAASYLRTKLGQNNVQGAVSLHSLPGLQVLVISTNLNDVNYETRIYHYGGKLLEDTVEASDEFVPGAGMQIAQLQSCSFSLAQDGLLTATFVSPAGTQTQTVFALAVGGGA